MGQKKLTKAQQIADLERQLAMRAAELESWAEVNRRTVVDLRAAQADLGWYRAEAEKAKMAKERKERDAEREARRKHLEDLSNGVIDLSRVDHTFGFDYDPNVEGATVTVALNVSTQEAKILNAYATSKLPSPCKDAIDASGSLASAMKRIMGWP